jgi:hypothetical protein
MVFLGLSYLLDYICKIIFGVRKLPSSLRVPAILFGSLILVVTSVTFSSVLISSFHILLIRWYPATAIKKHISAISSLFICCLLM